MRFNSVYTVHWLIPSSAAIFKGEALSFHICSIFLRSSSVSFFTIRHLVSPISSPEIDKKIMQKKALNFFLHLIYYGTFCVDSHKKRLTACVPHGIISTCVGMSHGICHTVRRDLP